MEYRIRKAIPEDEQRIRELFIEMLQTIYHTEDVEGYESGCLDRYWTNGEERILVAEDGYVVAYLSIEVHHEPDADFIYLDDLRKDKGALEYLRSDKKKIFFDLKAVLHTLEYNKIELGSNNDDVLLMCFLSNNYNSDLTNILNRFNYGYI